MKTKFKTILFLGALSLASLVQAGDQLGGGVGNGGWAVVCRNADKVITKAEMLDIFEGRELYERFYNDDENVDVESRLQAMKALLPSYFARKFDRELSKIYDNLIFVKKGSSVIPTDDAKPIIFKDEEGCNFEQVANYLDTEEMVVVSKEIYTELDNLNKAALYVHEVFYALYRQANGGTGSRNSRKLTAHLLSLNPKMKVIYKLLSNNENACGLFGTVEERIEDCNFSDGYTELVTSTLGYGNVYKDMKTGLLWSESLKKMNYAQTEKTCGITYKELDLNVSWGIPKLKELEIAKTNGVNLGGTGHVWTSEQPDGYDWISYAFYVPSGLTLTAANMSTDISAICVGR